MDAARHRGEEIQRLKVIRDRTPEILEVPDDLFLSLNSKTGYSINVSIMGTCRPTKACSEYCYALEGRLGYPAALAAQARNASFFANADDSTIRREARSVGRRVERRQSFVRMFGVGDLQPGSATFVTMLASEFPKLNVWVSTRKLDIAETLPTLTNLHVMMSCDGTTTDKNIIHVRRLIKERDGQFYAAWVRRDRGERVPVWVSVVFEEHHVASGRAKWDPEPRACPATVRDGLSHDGACAKCRFCFSTTKREKGTALSQIRRRK